MALTPGGTPYVESSDLVANYPAVSLALAEHIDDIGKILQVVRATDTTDRTTTSTTFVDASLSVTITPQKSTSAVLLISSTRFNNGASGNGTRATIQITDSSNNAISGAQGGQLKFAGVGLSTADVTTTLTLVGYATPATLSAVTYKMRFKADFTGVTVIAENSVSTGQLYAIEVSA